MNHEKLNNHDKLHNLASSILLTSKKTKDIETEVDEFLKTNNFEDLNTFADSENLGIIFTLLKTHDLHDVAVEFIRKIIEYNKNNSNNNFLIGFFNNNNLAENIIFLKKSDDTTIQSEIIDNVPENKKDIIKAEIERLENLSKKRAEEENVKKPVIITIGALKNTLKHLEKTLKYDPEIKKNDIKKEIEEIKTKIENIKQKQNDYVKKGGARKSRKNGKKRKHGKSRKHKKNSKKSRRNTNGRR
jgi:tetratricopeptide (TPR) repeat protein